MNTKKDLTQIYFTCDGVVSPFEFKVVNISFTIIAMIFCFDILAGPLRYYLSRVGLDFVIYLPKALGLLFVIHEIARRSVNRLFIYVSLVLVVFSVIGLLHQVDITSQLFTLFLVSPFLFGLVSARHFQDMEGAFVNLMIVVFMITAVGVYLDIFLDFPWKGFMYNIGSAEIEGSREWTTMGFERVAGFTRMSASAAFYLECSSLFLCCYSRRWWHKYLVIMVAFPAILATTNKAAIAGFVLAIISLVLYSFPRVLKLFIYFLASIVFLLPISTIVRSYEFSLADPVSLILLASFEDRLVNTWPKFFTSVTKFGNPFTGVGFGGAGSAIKYFVHGNREALAVADNFALYLYGLFGLLAVGLFLYFAYISNKLFTSQTRLTKSLGPVMVALLAASLTTDIIEAQVFALFLGIAMVSSRKCIDKTKDVNKGKI